MNKQYCDHCDQEIIEGESYENLFPVNIEVLTEDSTKITMEIKPRMCGLIGGDYVHCCADCFMQKINDNFKKIKIV